METIILKIIACSAIFIGLYYLFLEKEKTFKFNRFYLLFALVFSYVVPFLTIKLPTVEQPKAPIIFQENIQGTIIQTPIVEESFDWTTFILIAYGIVSLLLLIRGFISIFKILKLKGNLLKINNQKVRILEEEVSPFSFVNTIYLGKNYLKNEEIDERIFLHEQNHINQKHSWDLIFIEVLQIISWFNPALYFYKKAVKTNHEFLADEEVLKQNFELKSYQHLILNEVLNGQKLQFSNQFNYNNTKKRFIMMTKQNSKFARLKKILSFPIAILLLFFFVKKAYAQETVPEKNEKIEAIAVQIDENKMSSEEKKLVKKMKEEPDYKIDLRTNEIDTIRPKNNQEELPPPPPPREEAPWYKEKQPISPPSPVEKIENQTQPEFPGGYSELRRKIAENTDVSKINEDAGTLKGTIHIMVLEDGSQADIFTDFENKEFGAAMMEATNKSIKGVKWKPATLNGKNVNGKLALPITMKFEKKPMHYNQKTEK